jgi:hypothetical protein
LSYAFTYEIPITPDIYRRVREGVGDDRPKGLITHLAYRTDNGLRYLDVWHSKEDFDAFQADRLRPVVTSVMTDALGFVPPDPEFTMIDLVDVWSAEHRGA